MSNEILEERIAQLERENRKLNRRFKLGGLSLATLLAGVLLMGQAKDQNAVFDVVRAHRFEVVGNSIGSGTSKEYALAVLGWSGGDGGYQGLTIFSEDGKRVQTVLGQGLLNLADDEGNADIQIRAKDGAHLVLKGKEQNRINLEVYYDSNPFACFRDKDGKIIWKPSLSEEGEKSKRD